MTLGTVLPTQTITYHDSTGVHSGHSPPAQLDTMYSPVAWDSRRGANIRGRIGGSDAYSLQEPP